MCHIIGLKGYFFFLILRKVLRHHQPIEGIVAFTLGIETVFQLAQYLNSVFRFFISSISIHHVKRIVKGLIEVIGVPHRINVFAGTTP
jgi:hypothetical protein